MSQSDASRAPSRWARGMSLRSRVLVGLALIGLVSTVAAAMVLVTTRTYLVNQLDDKLTAFAGPKATGDVPRSVGDYGWGDETGSLKPTTQPDDWLTERPSDALRGLLLDDGSYTILLNPNVYPDESDGPSAPYFDVAALSKDSDTYLTVPSSGDDHYRILARPVTGGWEITGLSTEPVEAVSHRMLVIELLSIAVVLAGLGLVAWWVIRLGISPMRRMVNASALIADGDLSVRLDGAGSGTESAALATSLNTMIGRLSDSIKERERSEAQLREFVADASHELRTPLTTVLGYAQLHRKGGIEGKAKQADAWARTEAEASRMKRLVEDMLELARFDAEPQLRLASVDATRLVAEVLDDAARAHPDVTFEMDHVDVSLDVDSPVMFTVDADRLRQAVINVVTNAAHHGAAHVRVTVDRAGTSAAESAREIGAGGQGAGGQGAGGQGAGGQGAGANCVRIGVADDGPGMTPEIAARATERFVRGDRSRSRATGGAGLGLAITAAIVDAHRGRLTIASAVGEGTTVTIEIPA